MFNEVGLMVQMESHNLDKHIIKLEFGFNSSPMQSGNEKMSMIENGLMIQLLLLTLHDVPDPGLHNGQATHTSNTILWNGASGAMVNRSHLSNSETKNSHI